MSEEIITNNAPKAQIALNKNGLQLATLDDLWRFSQYVVKSGFAPKGMDKPESVLIAIEMGFEVGLSPMAALQNTAVVNGRPTIYGDAALALVRGSGLLESYSETPVGEAGKDSFGYCITAKRKGDNSTYSETFTVADAKTAGLWGKSGPWSQYPARMLKFRARGFLLRDAFGDVLKGMRTFEEVRDYVDADVEVVAEKPKKQKLFKPAEKPATPETMITTETPNFDDEPSAEHPQSLLEELAQRLESEGLTQAQLISWAKKQSGILAGGKLDEFGAQKILNAFDTVKEFIAREVANV